MSCEHPASADLPFFVNGTLPADGARRVREHLHTCASCRVDLELWQSVADAVHVGRSVDIASSSRVWDQRVSRRVAWGDAVSLVGALLMAQPRLLRGSFWASSAIVMVLGVAMSWLVARAGVLEALAPLIAAFGISHLYGPLQDPGFELAESTPTSSRIVLLARVCVVFGYDLGLAVAASCVLWLVVPGTALGGLITGWLAPMTCLSAVALLGAVAWNCHVGVSFAIAMWLWRIVTAGAVWPTWLPDWLGQSAAWWTHSWLPYAAAGLCGTWAVWLAGHRAAHLVTSSGREGSW